MHRFAFALVLLSGLACGKQDPPKTEPKQDAAPSGPVWDALAAVPQFEKARISFFDFQDIRAHNNDYRGTSARHAIGRVWSSLVKFMGVSASSLGQVIYIDELPSPVLNAFLVHTSMPADKIAEAFKGKGLVETQTKGHWKREGGGDWKIAAVEGWIVYPNTGEEIVDRILKVRAGKDPSMQKLEGLSQIVATAGNRAPLTTVEIPGLPDANVPKLALEWIDVKASQDGSAMIFATEDAVNAYMKMVQEHEVKDFKAEAHGKLVFVEGKRDRPEDILKTHAQNDLYNMTNALGSYAKSHGRYPTTEEGLAAMSKEFGPEEFLGEPPIDPWGHPYIYKFPHPKKPESYDLRSAGPDGKPDTIDDIFPKEDR